jgi:hypothetical protein
LSLFDHLVCRQSSGSYLTRFGHIFGDAVQPERNTGSVVSSSLTYSTSGFGRAPMLPWV